MFTRRSIVGCVGENEDEEEEEEDYGDEELGNEDVEE